MGLALLSPAGSFENLTCYWFHGHRPPLIPLPTLLLLSVCLTRFPLWFTPLRAPLEKSPADFLCYKFVIASSLPASKKSTLLDLVCLCDADPTVHLCLVYSRAVLQSLPVANIDSAALIATILGTLGPGVLQPFQ